MSDDAARLRIRAAYLDEKARKATRRALVWLGVSIASGFFGIGWTLRGILDGTGHS